jgi:hypothetical protein
MRSTDMQSVVIASPAPSVATNHAQGAGVAATTQAVAGKERCNACGADWQQAHFIAGRLLCERCWAGREPATSMVPTPRERQLLFEWIRPLNKGVSP